MIAEKRQTKAVDIWALGVIMYETFVNYSPFYSSNKLALIDKIKNCRYNKQKLENSDINPRIKELIKSCLVYDAS